MIEGTDGPVTNIDQLHLFERASTNPQVHFVEVSGADHFSDLARANKAIAAKIIADRGSGPPLSLTANDIGIK